MASTDPAAKLEICSISPLDYAKVIEWLWQNPGRKSQEMPEDFKPTFYDAIDRMGLWRMAQLMEERYAEE